jgi:hypothetical protein
MTYCFNYSKQISKISLEEIMKDKNFDLSNGDNKLNSSLLITICISISNN